MKQAYNLKKMPNGRWQIDFYVNKKRYRKQFDYQQEAKVYYQDFCKKLIDEQKNEKFDNRSLLELIEKYYLMEGYKLVAHIKVRSILVSICDSLNNPIARLFNNEEFLIYLQKRRAEGTSEKTLNNHLGYLKRVFNFLREQKVIDYENPIEKILPYRLQERPMTFLSKEEIKKLRAETEKCSGDVGLVVDLCLATGARWSEIITLPKSHINTANNQLVFSETKSKKVRYVAISQALMDRLLLKCASPHSSESIFADPRLTFFKCLDRAKITLPKGQATHVLRHTFASHFIQNGGDIITLQKILGHSELTMTMRYAHLAPNYLDSMLTKNPIAE